VTPHHLGFTDEWVAGARRWAWDAVDGAGAPRDPWADGALVAHPYATACRVNPPLRDAAEAAACLAALVDGTADAVATDHAPHTAVDKETEFGLAANGISGLEMAVGVLLAAVAAGKLPLVRAVAALTTGPATVLGARSGRRGAVRGLAEGAPADLVVVDAGDTWRVTPETLASRGKNTPLLGRELGGRVLLTVAQGRLAYRDPDA
jgi:dihydroorotase